MRLEKRAGRGNLPRRAPARTVTEIAAMLGIHMMKLQWAFRKYPNPPKPLFKGDAISHMTGRNRVWYDPKEVIRWYRTVTASSTSESLPPSSPSQT